MNRITRTLGLLVTVFTLAALIAPVASAVPLVTLITNVGFESKNGDAPAMDGWVVSNGSGDKIVCGANAKKLEGNCSFLFKGSANEASVLSQSMPHPAVLGAITALQDNIIYFMFRFDSASASTKFKTTLKVDYLPNGSNTPVTFKHVDKYNGAADWGYAGSTYAPYLPQHAQVLKVAISITNLSTGGKVYIDDVQLTMHAPIA